MENYYRTLGISPRANIGEIKKAYRKMCLIYHPDVGGSEDKFLSIKNAYENLIKNNVHQIRISYATCIDTYFVNSFKDINHIFLLDNINKAFITYKNEVVYTWHLFDETDIVLLIPKVFLIKSNYTYSIFFLTGEGIILERRFKIKDPRTKWMKFKDKIYFLWKKYK